MRVVQKSRDLVGVGDVSHANVRIAENFMIRPETGAMTTNMEVRKAI